MVRICLINSAAEEQQQQQQQQQQRSILDDPFEDERRLPFTVVSCSGQDEDFPVSELSKGASGRGWQTRKFCVYPQELVIELHSPAHVFTMQLLCHEYKISSKVEIFASVMANGSSKMKRLGHLTLDTNERTGFQARELKSIHINAPATSIRLLLHGCYPNKLNVYNQVGIVALIVTGELLSDEQIISYQLASPIPSETPITNVAKPRAVVDLSSVDSVTAQRIQRLQHEKEMAVQEEDYDEAKRLKILIGRLRTLGEHIKGLESRKRMAVEEEDYDQAKLCKLEIERLRQVDAAAVDPDIQLSPDSPAASKREGRRGPEMIHASVGTVQVVTLECGIQTQTSETPSFEERFDSDLNFLSLDIEDRDVYDSLVENRIESVSPLSDDDDYLIGKYDEAPVPLASAEAEAQNTAPDEELTPELLSEALRKQHSDMLTVMDQYHLRCLFSKHWQLRDKAIQYVEKGLESNRYMSDAIGSFRCIYKVLVRGLNDRVSHVFFASTQALKPFLLKFAPEVPARELNSCVGEVIAILLEKIGDTNPRTREACADSVMFFAMAREAGLPVVVPLILKVPKNTSAWRPILGRLQWLLVAIPKFGLQPRPRLGSGFCAEDLMHFVVHCFSNSNGEVRNAAMKVITEVYKFIGLSVEKYMKGVKPIIRESVVALFEKSSEEEVPIFPSSSQPKASFLKASSPNESMKVKNVKRSESPRPHQKSGKSHVDMQVRSVDRFEAGRAWDSSSDVPTRQVHSQTQHKSDTLQRHGANQIAGKPSCSATRR